MAHFKNVNTGQVVEAEDGRFEGLARWVEVEAPVKTGEVEPGSEDTPPADPVEAPVKTPRKSKKVADDEPVDSGTAENV